MCSNMVLVWKVTRTSSALHNICVCIVCVCCVFRDDILLCKYVLMLDFCTEI